MGHKLTFLDKTFWLTESSDNPKHIGTFQLLEMPEGVVPTDYVDDFIAELRSHNKAVAPFGCKVKVVLGYPVSLKAVKSLDMDYHVQLHKIASIDDRAALDDTVARLHESKLDHNKPLWQCYILHDGVSRQYALYVRIHHMYGDGATLLKWFQAGYQDKPQNDNFKPVWGLKRVRRQRTPSPIWNRIARGIINVLHVTRDLLVVFIRLLLRVLRINRHYMPVPFSGTRTVLTGQVKAGRAVATMDLDFIRVQQLGRRCRASVNEVLLCVFDIGVHRLMQDYGQVFSKALLTNMPINLRKPGEQTGGNKIAIVPVQLAHAEQDPYLRLRQIIYNHRIVKTAAQRANPASFSYYTIIIQSLALITEWLRLSDYLPPIANILVSNMPGPQHTLYLKDSKLLCNYPVSTMTPGGGVNITLLTYDGKAHVGLVCCNKNIKSLQPLARYIEEAFDMLEKSIDDPTLQIDDIGEHEEEVPISIVGETFQLDENQNLSK